jgi:hypothetical protein
MKHLALVILILFCLAPVMAQDATAVPSIPVETIPDETPAILSLTLGEALAILVGTLGALLAFGKILWDANQNPNGASVDTQLVAAVEERQSDRDYIESLEKAYAAAGNAYKTALDATVSVLQTIAPLTPLKVDDAALNLLRDIQTPGFTAQAANTGTSYTIKGNQDGVTISADTSPSVSSTGADFHSTTPPMPGR